MLRDLLQFSQHTPPDSAPALAWAHIHALDLAPAAWIAQERGAADRLALIAHHQEYDRRIGQRRDVEQMIALRRIERRISPSSAAISGATSG